MVIQIPNLGNGDGKTGDNEFVIRQKYNSNFNVIDGELNRLSDGYNTNTGDIDSLKLLTDEHNSKFIDQSNAASKLIGTDNGSIPLAQDVLKAANSRSYGFESSTSFDCNTLESGSRRLVVTGAVNAPPHIAGNTYYLINTITSNTGGRLIQIAYGYTVSAVFIRSYFNDAWSSWTTIAANQHIFNTTTAASPNVAVDSTGRLTRTSSSERYKDIIADLEFDDENYADAMSLNPIIYRSKSEIDNPDYHYYSFSAEALGAYDPAFTLWRDTETVTDSEGNTSEQPLDERVAEGINLNAIVAFLHATNVKQGKLIKAQAEAIETLTKRIDAMTPQ